MLDFYSEIIEQLKRKKYSKEDLNRLKNKLSKKYKLGKIPTDADILMHSKNFKALQLLQFLPKHTEMNTWKKFMNNTLVTAGIKIRDILQSFTVWQ